MKGLIFGCLTLLALGACADSTNVAIGAIAAEDRNERKSAKNGADWESIRVNDARRREAVRIQLEAGRISMGREFCDAATIYQRSNNASDLKIAFAFATLCSESKSGAREATRLQHTTWDRYMLLMGSGQWYATQFEWATDGELKLSPIAAHLVSDEDRARYGLPRLGTLESQLRTFNERKVALPVGQLPSWAEAVLF